MVLHIVNGAAVGALGVPLVLRVLRVRFRNVSLFTASVATIALEHIVTFPLIHVFHRLHPVELQGGMRPVCDTAGAFAAATYRHLLFGVVCGALLRK